MTRPVGENGEHTAVRVTFQTNVWTVENSLAKAGNMKDPALYQKFFTKLSRAVHLEAHEI